MILKNTLNSFLIIMLNKDQKGSGLYTYSPVGNRDFYLLILCETIQTKVIHDTPFLIIKKF